MPTTSTVRKLTALALALAGCATLAGCSTGSSSTASSDFGGFVGAWRCVGHTDSGGTVLEFEVKKDGSGNVRMDGTTFPIVVKPTSSGFTVNGAKYLPASAAKVTVPMPLPEAGKVSGKVSTKDGSYSAAATLNKGRYQIKATVNRVPWECYLEDGLTGPHNG